MSINTILNIGVSGLRTAQTGLKVTSDNISNVNTPGYVRKLVDQTSLSFDGRGAGVDVARIRLAADRFLQAASLNAAAQAGGAAQTAELFDRIQAQFGDPTAGADFFSRIDKMFAAFAAAADDPASGPARQQALSAVSGLFADADRVAASLTAARGEADGRIGSAVGRANALLEQIEALNVDISRQTVAGRDASGSQGQQARLIDELSGLMDVKLQERPQGGLFVRTASGMLLAGDGAARLSYTPSASSGQGGYGEVLITPARGEPRPLLDHVSAGEIKALADLRDRAVPEVQRRLAELVRGAAASVNAAHNAGSAVPAPASLSGRNTGLDLPTAIGGFSGRATVALTDTAGLLGRRVDIDFSAGTISVDGGAASGFTPASFLSSLNTALSPMGSASFVDGALTLSGAGGRGVSVTDDATAPSLKAGRTFAGFFGLNDLVRAEGFGDGATGLRSTDPHGFTAGQTLTFRLTGESGARLRDVTATVPAGGTMADLVASLNSSASGLGLYGAFALDADGRLDFKPATTPAIGFSVVGDTTSRGAGGPSLSALFALGGEARVASYAVRADVKADPRRLALAQLDLGALAGRPVLAIGDNRGALALAAAGDRGVSRSAATLSGWLGAAAQDAESRFDAAQAVAEEAVAQRSNIEGVNMDEELVKLTTYQQAFSASSRLIQAAKDMYDVLLNMA